MYLLGNEQEGTASVVSGSSTSILPGSPIIATLSMKMPRQRDEQPQTSKPQATSNDPLALYSLKILHMPIDNMTVEVVHHEKT